MMNQYDYIVVGAGSAGCVVATTLIEKNPDVTVLLLEAGPKDTMIHAQMPAGMPYMMANHTWPYVTEPEPYLNQRQMEVPQGKVLGGSSSVNGMAYVRGVAQDYDDWATRYGCQGWDYASVLADFVASENNESLTLPYHGTEGNQYVCENRYRHPLSLAFIRAGQEMGYAYVNDFNGQAGDGVGFFQATVHQGRRASTSYAWLNRVKGNPRLTVLTGCTTERLLIEVRVATGVVYTQKGRSHQVRANREVIVSSGAIGSPKVLLLSGIGPKADLAALGIDVVLDAPQVGKNYQDHLHVNLRGLLKEPISIVRESMGWKKIKHGLEWLLFQRGIASSNILEACGFFDLDGDGRRETQIHSFPLIENFGRQQGEDQQVVEGFTLKLGHLYPESRGQVKLKSADWRDLPVVQGQYLAEPNDLKAMVDAVKFGLTFFETPAMKKIISQVIMPAPEMRVSDEAIAEFVKDYALTVFHPVGTCAMGSATSDSVLDERLRVKGIAQLRVIDASSFPHIISGNTNAPTIMLAYRGARFILEDGLGIPSV
ncbi:MAG: GMC family oxidoreductase N-terminal domain-containing protein [Neisseriaceae bacterium]|nr:GMC family oxidoreductase N-terminal domain-containing protein [Neisseriaceae bacterium]